jgi:PAS domain S-box-containing protein
VGEKLKKGWSCALGIQLRATEEALRQYVRLFACPVLLIDDNDRIADFNATLAALLNTVPQRGEDWREWISVREKASELYRSAGRNGGFGGTVTIAGRTADEAPISASLLIQRVKTDARTGYYLLALYETKPGNRYQLLEQFAGTLMKDVHLGVLLVDSAFTLVEISDTACEMLGVERRSVIRKNMEEAFRSAPVEHRLVERTLSDGIAVRNHAVTLANNGERRDFLMDSDLLRDHDGNVAGAYVLFKDVTHLRSLEQQVQRSDRLAMIGQIAAGTAHEIRNPLTSIKGFLQVLHRTFIDNRMDKEQAYTELMLSEINRINELVNEFLVLSKPHDVSYDRVDVSSVLRDILPIINNQAVLHNVTIRYQSAFGMPEVIADRELLKQVFINLCKNGIEAMGKGGTLTIVEKIDAQAKRVCVDVKDEGPGIPAFLLDKIFDPFFTTKDNGTGLGLSVCQRIVQDIGGSIYVTSEECGATFTVSIPYQAV